jgi:hypothetical protein
MYYPKRWRDRAHSLTRVGIQYGIGLGNELLGGEEGGIKGTPIGMRTVVGTVGALTAAMGSDLGADAMYAALGSGAELAGKKTIEYWRGKREPAPVAAEPAQAQPAQTVAGHAEAAPKLALVPNSNDVLDALSPELRAEVEAVIEKRVRAKTRAAKKAAKPAPERELSPEVEAIAAATATAARRG